MNTKYRNIGIIYHGRLTAAKDFAASLERFLQQADAAVWRCAAAQEEEIRKNAPNSELVVSVGGDGTLLRAARAVATWGIPIVGINLGKLGFMTELTAAEAFEKLPGLLSGQGWTDVRAMISARTSHSPKQFQALNDVVIGRGSALRIIRIEARIDGQTLTEYRADGVIVATATGSTGYSLATGGPILHPQSRDILLQPICPHLSFAHCLVLPASAIIGLKVTTDHQAILSIDGQVETSLSSGEEVTVCLSESVVRLLRLHPPVYFFGSLTQRLRGEPVR
ncbi:MAG: NAD(+)/NADH kinase [Chloroflexota bacterium]